MDDRTSALATTGEHDGAAPGGPDYALLPTLPGRGGGGRRPPAWRRSLAGLVAVAAVIALVAGVFGALNLSGRLHGFAAPSTTRTAAPATLKPSGDQITSISMDSSSDGWALEFNTQQPLGGISVLHLVNGAASVAITLDSAGAAAPVIQALSPTDVWVMLSASPYSIYHFNGSVWAPSALTVPPGVDESTLNPQAFSMRSATDGWAAATYEVNQTQGNMTFSVSKLAFYHYDGTAWTLDPTSASLTGDYYTVNGNGVAGDQVVITGVSATPSGKVWATGFAGGASSTGGVTLSVGYLYERANGAWRLAATMSGYVPTSVVMSGDASGWILGLNQRSLPSSTNPGQRDIHATPAAYAWDGARWTQATLPALAQFQWTDNSALLAATSPTDIWAVAPSNQSLVTVGQTYANDQTYLVHFDGAAWSTASLPKVPIVNAQQGALAATVATFSRLAVAPNGDLWLAGQLFSPSQDGQVYPLLYHESGGVWSAIPIPRV